MLVRPPIAGLCPSPKCGEPLCTRALCRCQAKQTMIPQLRCVACCKAPHPRVIRSGWLIPISEGFFFATVGATFQLSTFVRREQPCPKPKQFLLVCTEGQSELHSIVFVQRSEKCRRMGHMRDQPTLNAMHHAPEAQGLLNQSHDSRMCVLCSCLLRGDTVQTLDSRLVKAISHQHIHVAPQMCRRRNV